MSRSVSAPHTIVDSDRGEIDEVTFRRAQRGETGAWRALITMYQRRVVALCARMLAQQTRAEIEDAAQETFLRVFRELPRATRQGAEGARLSTWILTIATRLCIDELRREARRDRDVGTPGSRPGDGAVDPESSLHSRRQGARLRDAVMALSPTQRGVLLLREYHGLEYTEIAAALELDIGTVKSRLSRARAAVRAALESHAGEENS